MANRGLNKSSNQWLYVLYLKAHIININSVKDNKYERKEAEETKWKT